MEEPSEMEKLTKIFDSAPMISTILNALCLLKASSGNKNKLLGP